MGLNLLYVLLFVLGFVLVIQGGSVFVEACYDVGKWAHVSSAFMGAGVLSLITTLPEIMVAILATAKCDYSLAIGNSIGSMICNFGVILAISFVVFPTKIKTVEFSNKLKLFAVLLTFFVIFIFDKQISLFEGIVLLLGFVFYYFVVIFDAIRFGKCEKELNIKQNLSVVSKVSIIVSFVVGTCSIALGAKAIVDNIAMVGVIFGINDKFLSLVIVAIGTSLPELVTALVSAKNGYAEMGIGNMIGANVVNCSFIIGVCKVVRQKSALLVSYALAIFGSIFLLLISALTLLPIVFKKKTSRLQGIIILCAYTIYTTILFFFV